jgi:hypothetical protein
MVEGPAKLPEPLVFLFHLPIFVYEMSINETSTPPTNHDLVVTWIILYETGEAVMHAQRLTPKFAEICNDHYLSRVFWLGAVIELMDVKLDVFHPLFCLRFFPRPGRMCFITNYFHDSHPNLE